MSDQTYILVTGGAGYIGSHTCKYLSQRGFTPVTFDNLSNGHRHAVRYGPLIEGDLLDVDALKSAFDQYDFKAVIHFAGVIEVGESVENPAKYYRNNVQGSLNLLEAMRAADVTQIVFSSTCAVYGQPKVLPITEDTLRAPISPYGMSKYMVERLLEDYQNSYGFQYIACRYFNACGADESGEIGEQHDPETHLIPRVFMALEGNLPAFSIYGDDYDTLDGTCVRDYIHVNDLAQAHFKALEHLFKTDESFAVNLGSGRGYSVREMFDTIQAVTQKTLDVRIEKRRAGDPPTLLADTSKAKEVLGFAPEHSDIEHIIKTAWNFYRKLCKRSVLDELLGTRSAEA